MTNISKLVSQEGAKPFFAACYLTDMLKHFQRKKGKSIYYEFVNNLET